MQLDQVDVAILCGGLGTRLRGQVGKTQKILAKIDDKPFLDILLKYLRKQGFRNIILCTGFQAQDVEAYYQQHNFDLNIKFSKEDHPLGTGGAISHARSSIKTDPFIILNGDCFCALDYKAFVGEHINKHPLATLVVSSVKDQSDFGSISLDEGNRILKFEEKKGSLGRSAYVNAGIYCFQKSVFELMPQEAFSVEKDFFPKHLDKEFMGYVTDEDFIDIGTPDRYKEAQEILKNKE